MSDCVDFCVVHYSSFSFFLHYSYIYFLSKFWGVLGASSSHTRTRGHFACILGSFTTPACLTTLHTHTYMHSGKWGVDSFSQVFMGYTHAAHTTCLPRLPKFTFHTGSLVQWSVSGRHNLPYAACSIFILFLHTLCLPSLWRRKWCFIFHGGWKRQLISLWGDDVLSSWMCVLASFSLFRLIVTSCAPSPSPLSTFVCHIAPLYSKICLPLPSFPRTLREVN